jgi:hypothetical protein
MRDSEADKMLEPRGWLIDSLQQHLVPALVQQGFEAGKAEASRPFVDRKFVKAFPFAKLIRVRESAVEQISIQLASNDRCAFRINASVVPPKKMVTAKLPPVVGLEGKGLSEQFEMYEYPILWAWLTAGWFSVRTWPFQTPSLKDYEKLALRVSTYVPELDLALSESKLGPHMRRALLPYYVPGDSPK